MFSQPLRESVVTKEDRELHHLIHRGREDLICLLEGERLCLTLGHRGECQSDVALFEDRSQACKVTWIETGVEDLALYPHSCLQFILRQILQDEIRRICRPVLGRDASIHRQPWILLTHDHERGTRLHGVDRGHELPAATQIGERCE